jgi:hypothetical protein
MMRYFRRPSRGDAFQTWGLRNTKPACWVSLGQVVEDQPHLVVVKPDGLSRWGGLVRLCQD